MKQILNASASDIVIALVVMLLSWLLARLARRSARRILTGLGWLTSTQAEIATRAVGYLVLLIGAGLALTVLGVGSEPLVAAVLVVLALLAFVAKGFADNFAAGLVLQARQPISLGEWVEAMGQTGVVRELTGRTVVIETVEGNHVHLPNGPLLDGVMANLSRHGPRRSDIEVHVSGGGPVPETLARLAEIAGQAPGMLTDPAPAAIAVAWEPNRLIARVQVWHDAENRNAVSILVTHLAEHRAVTGTAVVSAAGRTEDLVRMDYLFDS